MESNLNIYVSEIQMIFGLFIGTGSGLDLVSKSRLDLDLDLESWYGF